MVLINLNLSLCHNNYSLKHSQQCVMTIFSLWLCSERESKLSTQKISSTTGALKGTTQAVLNFALILKDLLETPGRLERLGVFTNREPDIHMPPNSPISKYTWRTKLFCLTCFLVVTLSAALHSSGLVLAWCVLLYTGYRTFLSFVCSSSDVWEPPPPQTLPSL